MSRCDCSTTFTLRCSSLTRTWTSTSSRGTGGSHAMRGAIAARSLQSMIRSVVLLHGPPGTGKTSLCRALAQKLAIRLNERYSQGRLVEINSHSLFSKWFSESGKLVQRLFSMVTELVDDEQSFVVILIGELRKPSGFAGVGFFVGRGRGSQSLPCRMKSSRRGGKLDSGEDFVHVGVRTIRRLAGRECTLDAIGQAQESQERPDHDDVQHLRVHR